MAFRRHGALNKGGVGKIGSFLSLSLNGLSTDTKIDDLGWPWTAQGQIPLEFRDISRVSEAITAKRMKIARIVSNGIVAH